MPGRITHQPTEKHHCYAGWRIETDEEMQAREAQQDQDEHDDGPLPFNLPPGYRRLIRDHPWPVEGTIWTCDDCGARWRATYPYVNVFAPTWVRCMRPVLPPRWWVALKGLFHRD